MHAANHPVGVVITPSCLTDVPDVSTDSKLSQRLYEFTNTAADFVPNASVETGLFNRLRAPDELLAGKQLSGQSELKRF